MYFLWKFLPSAVDVCGPIGKQTSPECKWTWNNTWQNLYNRAINIIKKNVAMVVYINRNNYTLKQMHQVRPRNKSSATEGQKVVPKEWSTWQCSVLANNICNQMPDRYETLPEGGFETKHTLGTISTVKSSQGIFRSEWKINEKQNPP